MEALALYLKLPGGQQEGAENLVGVTLLQRYHAY